MEENERLRRNNAALLAELAHMRKLYNDIIYFVQNHVQPVAPSSASSPFLVNPHGYVFHTQRSRKGGLNNNNNNSGSTTSSSSLTIVEEPQPIDHNNNNSANGESQPKLFGVTLREASSSSNNKRGMLHSDDPNASSSTKPRLVLGKEDLGFNPMPSSPSSSS